MKCPFKNCGNKEDIKEFDNAAEHLVMVMSIQGSVHVHGPFGNEYVIRKMADAFMAELEKKGIQYTPPTQHLPGN
jgi:accessory colonization factor AcfC